MFAPVILGLTTREQYRLAILSPDSIIEELPDKTCENMVSEFNSNSGYQL